VKISLSLKVKILGLVLITCIVLSAVSLFLNVRQCRESAEQRNIAVRQADVIAQNGSIERYRRILEKVTVNLLNTDELLSFMSDSSDSGARMVIEGLFLSFKEGGIARFLLYDKDRRLVLEQSNDRPDRATELPPQLEEIYQAAEKDFNFHYYFRGVEQSSSSFPVEYCAVTVITDDDDNTIGFAELALEASLWVKGTAELTENTASLYDPVNGMYTFTTDENFFDTVNGEALLAQSVDGLSLVRTGSTWLLTDILPILGPEGKETAYLLISRDATEAVNKQRRGLIFTTTVSGVIILCSLLLAYFVTVRGIVRPIDKVISFAKGMADGHFVDSLGINTGDEIEEMSLALNEMAEKIRHRAKEAEAISTGDLTTEITIQSEDDVLGTSLKKIVDNLGDILNLVNENAESLRLRSEQVSSFAENIKGSSETIKDRSASISLGSDEISSDIEKLASATEEMSASIKEISESTTRSKTISAEANSLSEKAGKTIKNLDQSAVKIEKASETISDFADQTSLLALNATIEAARAGELGKGFAVVAAEVKELAIQSITTAKSISNDIDEIQNYTVQVVEQTSKVGEKVNLIDETALVISSALYEQSTVANELAGTINVTHERIRNFAHNIFDINESIRQNNEVIISLSASAQEMSELSGKLRTAVGRFKLPRERKKN
jgi:methyl-accepting chemotaxis protein